MFRACARAQMNASRFSPSLFRSIRLIGVDASACAMNCIITWIQLNLCNFHVNIFMCRNEHTNIQTEAKGEMKKKEKKKKMKQNVQKRDCILSISSNTSLQFNVTHSKDLSSYEHARVLFTACCCFIHICHRKLHTNQPTNHHRRHHHDSAEQNGKMHDNNPKSSCLNQVIRKW